MNDKFLLFFIPVLFISSSLLHGQNEAGAAKNTTYIEAGTNVIFLSASLNYERIVKGSELEKFDLYGRFGIGASGMFWGHSGWGGIAGLTLLTGKKTHHFETNFGAFVGYERNIRFSGEIDEQLFVFPLLDIGYRYQEPGKGFLFRAKVGILGVGIGLGYAF